jgi:hypothetical protein
VLMGWSRPLLYVVALDAALVLESNEPACEDRRFHVRLELGDAVGESCSSSEVEASLGVSAAMARV